MSENSGRPTDWTAMALQAMDRQRQDESATALPGDKDRCSSYGLARFAAGIVQLLFLVALGYFLINQYGVIHLIWIALVIWFLVIPSMTFRKRSAYQ